MNPDSPDKKSDVSIQQLLTVLEKGTINAEHGILRWSSNYAFLVTITHDDTSVLAVYKPQKGERPLWDFPTGTLCYREVAAFLTSQRLGWRIVPPTVLRSGPHGLGSVQFYVDHDPDINYFTLGEETIPQLMRFAAFDYVINNADRKGGHCLLGENGHIWGIDHGITFHSVPKLRTVIWDFSGHPVPDTLLEDISKVCEGLEEPENPFCRALEKLLSGNEINALRERLRRMLESQRYPKPGPGPNYPWPPV